MDGGQAVHVLGGVLEHAVPPIGVFCCVHRHRLEPPPPYTSPFESNNDMQRLHDSTSSRHAGVDAVTGQLAVMVAVAAIGLVTEHRQS